MIGEFFKYLGLTIVTMGLYAIYWNFRTLELTRIAAENIAELKATEREVEDMRDALK